MDSSSSSLHLAMAALVGASFMAISAFYIHKRAVDQVLDRLIQIRHKHPLGHDLAEQLEEDEEEYERVDVSDRIACPGPDDDAVSDQQNCVSRSVDDSVLRRYRMSSSLPNISFGNDWQEEDAKFDEAVRIKARECSTSSLDKLNTVPTGLPPLQTTRRLGMVIC